MLPNADLAFTSRFLLSVADLRLCLLIKHISGERIWLGLFATHQYGIPSPLSHTGWGSHDKPPQLLYTAVLQVPDSCQLGWHRMATRHKARLSRGRPVGLAGSKRFLDHPVLLKMQNYLLNTGVSNSCLCSSSPCCLWNQTSRTPSPLPFLTEEPLFSLQHFSGLF